MARARQNDLDVGRGLMMVLLVFRHTVSHEMPTGNDWYVLTYHVMQWFQMPFFMFLTGIIMGLTAKPLNGLHDYAGHVWKKFRRFIPAYVLMAGIVFCGKLLTQSLTAVEKPIGSWTDFLTIFLAPKESPFASYLWFLYVLFLYHATLPLALRLTRGRLWPLLIAALALHFAPLPPFMALNLYGEYLIFLLAGMAVQRRYESYLAFIDRYRWRLVALFALACLVTALVYMPYLPAALTSLPALHGLVRTGPLLSSRVLNACGRYMYPIYLMNTIPINIGRIVMLHLVSWNGPGFLVVLPVLMTLGLAVPILLQKYVISRAPVLSKIMA